MLTLGSHHVSGEGPVGGHVTGSGYGLGISAPRCRLLFCVAFCVSPCLSFFQIFSLRDFGPHHYFIFVFS